MIKFFDKKKKSENHEISEPIRKKQKNEFLVSVGMITEIKWKILFTDVRNNTFKIILLSIMKIFF
jgi:hypothetical protein